MEYVFGTVQRGCKELECLKTIGDEHSALHGRVVIRREYPDRVIEDAFSIVEHYSSAEDVDGRCYDWYVIDNHSRDTDTSRLLLNQIEAVTPHKETKTAYIGDTEVVFSNQPGNLTVFFPYPYTVEREADRITVHFDELEEVTEVTISIL